MGRFSRSSPLNSDCFASRDTERPMGETSSLKRRKAFNLDSSVDRFILMATV